MGLFFNICPGWLVIEAYPKVLDPECVNTINFHSLKR